MSAIGKAFEAIGNGIKSAFEGAGQLIKGVCTLDLKGALAGAGRVAGGALEAASGAASLQPSAMCANCLLDGALERLAKQLQARR